MRLRYCGLCLLSELTCPSKVTWSCPVISPSGASAADSYNGLKEGRNTAYPKETKEFHKLYFSKAHKQIKFFKNVLKQHHTKHLVSKLHLVEILTIINVLDAPSWLKKHVTKLFERWIFSFSLCAKLCNVYGFLKTMTLMVSTYHCTLVNAATDCMLDLRVAVPNLLGTLNGYWSEFHFPWLWYWYNPRLLSAYIIDHLYIVVVWWFLLGSVYWDMLDFWPPCTGWPKIWFLFLLFHLCCHFWLVHSDLCYLLLLIIKHPPHLSISELRLCYKSNFILFFSRFYSQFI